MSFAHYQEQQTSGTNGGASASGSYQTRVLNTEVSDADGIGTLASNQVTLAAGTYEIMGIAPLINPQRCRLRLQNITDAATTLQGVNNYINASSHGGIVTVAGKFTIVGTKAFELQTRVEVTQSVYGLGIADSFGDTEVYSELRIWKVA